MSDTLKKKLMGWLPYVLGVGLVVQFFGLSMWQFERGLEKRATQEAFSAQTGFAAWSDGMAVRSFQKVKATGEFDSDHQILLENIIINNRMGYYVLTPLVTGENEPVLLINRGWIERIGKEFDASTIALESGPVAVRGRAGSLPGAGYRMGDSVSPRNVWPRMVAYPKLDELAQELGRDVQPFVLLMDPKDSLGFFRHWVPEEMGAAQHFGYTLQWFAMGVVLAGLLLWNYRRRGLESAT